MLDHHALADEIGQRIAEQAAAALQRRQARAALRTVLAERRKHGKSAHHAQRLAPAKQEPSMNQQRAVTPSSVLHDARGTRTHPTSDGGTPPRRQGRQAGYPGREELHAANKALARELSRLARDPGPVARQAGADIAAAVAEIVATAAGLADTSSTRSQRAAVDVRKQLPKLTHQIDVLQARLAARGVDLSGPSDPRKP